MAFVLENAKRRRLVGKQRTPAQWVLPPAALAALADEARSEVITITIIRACIAITVTAIIVIVVLVPAIDRHNRWCRGPPRKKT